MKSSKKPFFDKVLDFKEKLFSKNIDVMSYNIGSQVPAYNINRVSLNSAYSIVGDDPKAPIFPEWYFTVPFGQPRRVDIHKIRTFARSPWVKMCINTLIKSILRTKWDIVKKDPEDEKNYDAQIKKVVDFLDMPNQEGTSWDMILTEYMTDILEIDSAGLYLRRDNNGKLIEMYNIDGGSLLQDIDIHRRIRAYWQYSWKNPIAAPLKYEKNEILYDMMHRATYRLYGWSPLMSVVQTVELLMQALRYNREFFINNGVPDAIVGIENAGAESFKNVKNKWEEDMKGKPHRIMFMNGKLNYTPIVTSNREMEWLEGQKWYMKQVFAAYGLSAASVGYYEDVNRAEGKNQSNNTDINALLPYLNHLAQKFTNELIPAILGEEDISMDDRTPICYKYFPVGTAEEQVIFDNDHKELQSQTMTINEYRQAHGRKPFDSEYADNPFKEKETREDSFFPSFGDVAPDIGEDKKPPEKPKESDGEKPEKKKLNFEELKKNLPDMDTEAYDFKDYGELFLKVVNSWEKSVLKALSIVNKSELNKSFGDFVQAVFNSINSSNFIKSMRKVIRENLLSGIQDAETELNIDIGAGEPVSRAITQLWSQQFDGYTINGKKWHGIKGVTGELQQNILDTVKDGVLNKKSLEEIRKDVSGIFEGVKKSRAMSIARTESARFQNQGRLIGFQESGLRGKKVWDSFLDDRTSDICRRLNGQIVDLNEEFTDEEWSGLVPPAHPGCRSIIRFIPDEDQ